MGDTGFFIEGDSETRASADRNVLDDILEKDTNQGDEIFKTYKESRKIGEEICEDFIKKYGRKRGKGFYLSEGDTSEIGLLTQCRGLSCLAMISKFGTDVSPYQSVVADVLEDVIKRLKKSDGVYVFDVSPYLKAAIDLDGSELSVDNYIDSISQVMVAMLDVRDMLFCQKQNDKPLEFSINGVEDINAEIEDIVDHCILRLTNAAIPENQIESYTIEGIDMSNYLKDSKINFKGWNFVECPGTVNDQYEPSLYFTYVVSLAYMRLYESLSGPIRLYRDAKKFKKEISPEEESKIRENEQFYMNDLFFKRIQRNYERFYKACVDAGRRLELDTRSIDIAEDFIGRDYGAVSVEDIMRSTTSDALFNTLMALSISVNFGIDLDYQDASRKKYGNDSLYNANFDRMNFALQNVQKCLKILQSRNKEHIVDQYILSFNENIPQSLQNQANILRNLRIPALSLNPTLIKTYNSISEYLIRYPQKQAVTYLESIMENRSPVKSGKSKWIWDKNGYNLNSTYWYIEALRGFYVYYDRYERKYAINETARRDELKRDFSKRENDIKKEYETKFEDQRLKIDKLERDLEKPEPLVEEVKAVVMEVLNEQLASNVEEILNKLFIEIKQSNRKESASPIVVAFGDAAVASLISDKVVDLELKDTSTEDVNIVWMRIKNSIKNRINADYCFEWEIKD